MLAMKDLQDIALHNITRIAVLDKGHGDLRTTMARLEERLARLERRPMVDGRQPATMLRLVK